MSSTLRPWHQRIFGSSASLSDLNLIFWGLFLLVFVAPFSIIVISSGRPPDGDFAGFYSLGRFLNEHPISDCMILSPQNGPLASCFSSERETQMKNGRQGQVHALSQAGGGSAFEVWPRH
jgi:hypothetical protein